MCCHVRRLLYKVKGPAAKLNFGLSDERRAELDAMSVEELVQSYRQAVKDTQTSRFVGVSWNAKDRKWQAYINVQRDGKQVTFFGGNHNDEETAARQADE
jgi:hypothetical protein